MTEVELLRIEFMTRHVGVHTEAEFIDAIHALVAEVRRCGGPWERIEAGAKAWDEMQKAKR